jgi:hypothetical protein
MSPSVPLVEPERRADRHEERHLDARRIELPEDLPGDHAALAVRDDDERAVARDEALAERRLHRLAALGAEEKVVDVAEERPGQRPGDPGAEDGRRW